MNFNGRGYPGAVIERLNKNNYVVYFVLLLSIEAAIFLSFAERVSHCLSSHVPNHQQFFLCLAGEHGIVCFTDVVHADAAGLDGVIVEA